MIDDAAMRVCAIECAYESISEIKIELKSNCHYTHHHSEAVTGAQAVAIAVFLARKGYNKKDSIRKAISVGGDSDTIACMTSGIAQAYYKMIPKEIIDKGNLSLDSGLKSVLREFEERYHVKRGTRILMNL